MTDALKVLCWNINGLRSVAQQGFVEWLEAESPDVLGVQETRAEPEQLEEALLRPLGYHSAFAWAERKGYSGVALYSKVAPDEVVTTLDAKKYDVEGRFVLARFGALTIVNAYFPNGSGKDRDNSRVPYKLGFYRRVLRVVERERRAGGRVLVMGDFNTAHQEIDLARPKQNTKTSGFLEEERAELDGWLKRGWVDTFRAFDAEPGRYTWWSQRSGVRERNVGWRIDYILASAAAMEFVQDAFIQAEVRGSDHCPIGVKLKGEVLSAV